MPVPDSDKHFWHRYTATYRVAFRRLGAARCVLEFGVLHGASIAWLAEAFPDAVIIGADLVAAQPEWPRHPRISYRQVDQADRTAVRALFAAIAGGIDLVIDDGSHIPQHQALCLAEGMRFLRPGGLYVVEDIATSHPLHPGFAQFSTHNGRRLANALNVLLAIQHHLDAGLVRTAAVAAALTGPGMFDPTDIDTLFATTGQVELFKRTQLPLRCYACGGNDFDYVSWLCRCGAELYHPADSMTALVWKR